MEASLFQVTDYANSDMAGMVRLHFKVAKSEDSTLVGIAWSKDGNKWSVYSVAVSNCCWNGGLHGV